MTHDYNKWLENGQPKIFCKCGCGGEIIIKNNHRWFGIPEYIRGHNSVDRCWSEEIKQKISRGSIGRGKGILKTEEHRQKMRESHVNCFGDKNSFYGRQHTEEYKLKSRNRMLGKYSNEKHWNWKGGITNTPYCEKWTEELREEIRERDNKICQNCGKNKEENHNRKLSVHHIHYKKEDCYPDLITLCCGCNVKANYNRDYWIEFYMKILEKRNLLNYFGDLK